MKLDLGYAAVTGYLSEAQQQAMYLHNGPVTVTVGEQELSWRHQDHKRGRLSCGQLGLARLQLRNPSEVTFNTTGNVQEMFRLAVVNPALQGRKKVLCFQPVTGRLVLESENYGK